MVLNSVPEHFQLKRRDLAFFFGVLTQTEKLPEIKLLFGQTVQTALSEQLPEQSKAALRSLLAV